MDNLINSLRIEFEQRANKDIARGQKAYMKDKFEFFGIKTPVRRKIQNTFFNKNNLPDKNDLPIIVKTLWNKPEREYQYFSQELVHKYKDSYNQSDIELFIDMVVNKSWWDTVDFIAIKLMGEYFKLFPFNRNKYIENWLSSGNLWLQRSSIIFQLKYKNKVDTDFLAYVINAMLGSKEFFINKAIGWALREYSKTNPDWVLKFVNITELDKLSRKEALRLMN